MNLRFLTFAFFLAGGRVLCAQEVSDLDLYREGGAVFVRADTGHVAEKSFSDVAGALRYATAAFDKTGGQITIHRGVYTLSESIELPSNVVIKGSGRSTRLNLAPGVKQAFLASGKGSVIQDLAIFGTPDQTGIVLDSAGDCHIHGILVQGFGYGIWVRNSSFLISVTDCSAADNQKAGYYFDHLSNGRAGNFIPNLISNCIAYGGGNGFETKHAIVLNLVGCLAYQTKGYGFYFHDGSFSVCLSGSRTFQVGKDALREENSGELNASSNIFCWSRGNGIVLDKVNWATISADNVIDSGVRTADGSFRDGIVLQNRCRGVQITGNAIFNWGDQCPMKCGIVADKTCEATNIVSNNINFYVEKDIIAEGANTVVANNVSYATHSYGNDGRKPFPDFTSAGLDQFLKQ